METFDNLCKTTSTKEDQSSTFGIPEIVFLLPVTISDCYLPLLTYDADFSHTC